MAWKLNIRNNKIHTSEVLPGCVKYQFPGTPLFSRIPPVNSLFYFSFFLSQNLPFYSSQTSLKLLFFLLFSLCFFLLLILMLFLKTFSSPFPDFPYSFPCSSIFPQPLRKPTPPSPHFSFFSKKSFFHSSFLCFFFFLKKTTFNPHASCWLPKYQFWLLIFP